MKARCTNAEVKEEVIERGEEKRTKSQGEGVCSTNDGRVGTKDPEMGGKERPDRTPSAANAPLNR